MPKPKLAHHICRNDLDNPLDDGRVYAFCGKKVQPGAARPGMPVCGVCAAHVDDTLQARIRVLEAELDAARGKQWSLTEALIASVHDTTRLVRRVDHLQPTPKYDIPPTIRPEYDCE